MAHFDEKIGVIEHNMITKDQMVQAACAVKWCPPVVARSIRSFQMHHDKKATTLRLGCSSLPNGKGFMTESTQPMSAREESLREVDMYGDMLIPVLPYPSMTQEEMRDAVADGEKLTDKATHVRPRKINPADAKKSKGKSPTGCMKNEPPCVEVRTHDGSVAAPLYNVMFSNGDRAKFVGFFVKVKGSVDLYRIDRITCVGRVSKSDTCSLRHLKTYFYEDDEEVHGECAKTFPDDLLRPRRVKWILEGGEIFRDESSPHVLHTGGTLFTMEGKAGEEQIKGVRSFSTNNPKSFESLNTRACIEVHTETKVHTTTGERYVSSVKRIYNNQDQQQLTYNEDGSLGMLRVGKASIGEHVYTVVFRGAPREEYIYIIQGMMFDDYVYTEPHFMTLTYDQPPPCKSRRDEEIMVGKSLKSEVITRRGEKWHRKYITDGSETQSILNDMFQGIDRFAIYPRLPSGVTNMETVSVKVEPIPTMQQSDKNADIAKNNRATVNPCMESERTECNDAKQREEWMEDDMAVGGAEAPFWFVEVKHDGSFMNWFKRGHDNQALLRRQSDMHARSMNYILGGCSDTCSENPERVVVSENTEHVVWSREYLGLGIERIVQYTNMFGRPQIRRMFSMFEVHDIDVAMIQFDTDRMSWGLRESLTREPNHSCVMEVCELFSIDKPRGKESEDERATHMLFSCPLFEGFIEYSPQNNGHPMRHHMTYLMDCHSSGRKKGEVIAADFVWDPDMCMALIPTPGEKNCSQTSLVKHPILHILTCMACETELKLDVDVTCCKENEVGDLVIEGSVDMIEEVLYRVPRESSSSPSSSTTTTTTTTTAAATTTTTKTIRTTKTKTKTLPSPSPSALSPKQLRKANVRKASEKLQREVCERENRRLEQEAKVDESFCEESSACADKSWWASNGNFAMVLFEAKQAKCALLNLRKYARIRRKVLDTKKLGFLKIRQFVLYMMERGTLQLFLKTAIQYQMGIAFSTFSEHSKKEGVVRAATHSTNSFRRQRAYRNSLTAFRMNRADRIKYLTNYEKCLQHVNVRKKQVALFHLILHARCRIPRCRERDRMRSLCEQKDMLALELQRQNKEIDHLQCQVNTLSAQNQEYKMRARDDAQTIDRLHGHDLETCTDEEIVHLLQAAESAVHLLKNENVRRERDALRRKIEEDMRREMAIAVAAASVSPSPSPSPPPLSDVNECIVCNEAPKQVMITPCNHISLCEKCAKAVHKCPYCSGPIEGRQRVYLT